MQYSEILVTDLAIKSRSKNELYNLLINEGGLYLPPKPDAHCKFISDILVGDAKCLKSSEIRVRNIPHLKGLTVQNLLDFSEDKVDIHSYLPKYEYKKLPNREWLANIINTLIPAELDAFIAEKLNERVKLVVMKKSLNIKALPEFIEVFKKAKNISTINGRSHFLIKRAGRRKWDEVKKDDPQMLKDEVAKSKKLEQEIERLSGKLEMLSHRYEDVKDENERLSSYEYSAHPNDPDAMN